jgi:ABC-type Fe3+/spermidine/putrescine transport system ATPase subunit
LGSAKIARTPLIGAVDVLIRPERLRRVMAGENMDGLNVIKMTVDAIINYGDSILAIGTAAGLPIRVRLSGLEPDAPASGDTITLGWSPADAHLIPRES